MRRNRDFVNKQSSGPLLTNHLRDLDMELELLKRKREILQQEHNMISRISRQTNQRQPSTSFTQMNPESDQFQPPQVETSNFADFFEPQPRNFRQGSKRPNQSDWQPSNAKRFNSEYVNPWQDGVNQPKRQNQQPKKGFSSTQQMSAKPGIGQRLKRENKNSPRDFQPTKVTKNRPRARRDNPRARPQPVIVSNTNEAMNLVSEAKTPQPNDQILMADRQPTLQMKGRMELALGSILKELRQELSNDPGVSEYFANHYIQRILKRIIRSRIRDVMMDKAIGSINNIIENYRNAYPKETDVEILTTVKEAEALGSKNLNVAHLIESDDPQDFFKWNMSRILSNKLDGLFSKLLQSHETKAVQVVEAINKLPEPRTSGTNQVDTNEKIGLQKILNNFFESVPDNELLKALGCRIEKAKHYIDFMDYYIEEKLPKVLPKFKDVIINIVFHDREFIGAKSMVMAELKKKMTAQNGTELKKDDNIIGDQEAEKEEKIIGDQKAEKDDNIIGDQEAKKEEKIIGDQEAKKDDNIIGDQEAKKDDNIKGDQEAKKDDNIIGDQEAKKDDIPMEQVQVLPADEALTAGDTKEKKQLYYVKLIGRPKLPSRAVIYEFLNKYNSKTIKKHKTINNLLVLTFANKADYDKILTANKTVIGDTTIHIKSSEQVINKNTNQNTSQKKDESQNSYDNKIIEISSNDSDGPASLDDQIDNLLSTKGKADKEMVVPSCGNDKQNNDNTATSDKPVEDDDNISESNNNVEGNDIITENNDTVEGNDKIADNNDIKEGNDKITDNNDIIEVTDKIADNNDIIEVTDKIADNNDIIEVTDKIADNNDIIEVTDKIADNNDIIEVTDSNDFIEVTDKIAENNDIIEGNEKISENKDKMKDKEVTDKINEGNTKSHIDKDDIKNNDVSKENVNFKPSGDSMKSEAVGTKDTVKKNEIFNKVEELKEPGKSTPVRYSSRLASTPSGIRTRRTSRLAKNNT